MEVWHHLYRQRILQEFPAHDGASHLPANTSDEPRTIMTPRPLLPRLMTQPAVIMAANPQVKLDAGYPESIEDSWIKTVE